MENTFSHGEKDERTCGVRKDRGDISSGISNSFWLEVRKLTVRIIYLSAFATTSDGIDAARAVSPTSVITANSVRFQARVRQLELRCESSGFVM